MEVILYACIPDGVPSFATSCVTSLAGAFLLLAAFYRRALAALRNGGRRLVMGTMFLAALSALLPRRLFIAAPRPSRSAESYTHGKGVPPPRRDYPYESSAQVFPSRARNFLRMTYAHSV